MQLLHTNPKDNCIVKNTEKQSLGCFSILRGNLFLLIGILVAIFLCMYGVLGVFGFSAFPDEFGYWAPAAAILGYDWSQITALGSYYSYGYSIILVPFLLFFSSSITAYRAAIIVNLVLQCLSFVMLYKIILHLYPNLSKNARAIVTSVAILYPAWVFYTQTTMTEALLNFLVVFGIFLMMKFLDNPKALTGILFGIILIYSYFVHMRCLGMIGAGFITLLLWALGKRKKSAGKKYIGLLLLIPILFAVSFIIKDRVVAMLYHGTSADMLSWNDYSSVPARLAEFFNLNAIKGILYELCGKMLYISFATLGAGFFGFYALIKNFVRSFGRIWRKEGESRDYLWVYIELVVFMQFMVALIYLNGASSIYNTRLDTFLHGRYIDFFLPVLIAIGLNEMLETKKLIPIGIVSFVLTIICDQVAYYVISINEHHMYNAHGFTMIGMSYFVTKPLEDPYGYLMKESLLQLGLMIGTFIIVLLYRKFKFETFLLLIMSAQILLGLNACDHFIFKNQAYIYGDIILGQTLEVMRAEHPDRKIVHVYEKGVPYIELVQFEDKEADIQVINGEFADIDITPYLDKDTILILDATEDYCSLAEEFYSEKWLFGHLIMFYEE